MMMKKIVTFAFLTLAVFNKAKAQLNEMQNVETDSTLMYKNGEGVFINIGKAGATKINIFSTIQSGIQLSKIDSGASSSNSNRMSLNLARLHLNFSGLKDKVQMGIVTDFTSTTPILEGWVGFNFWNKRGKLIVGQRQTHTNNRLAMADERFATFMGQTLAGKSNDGSVYGGLIQNFVGTLREGGIFFEPNFSVKKWKFYPSVSITTGEGQNFFNPTPNVGLKYGGRLDILPLGDFIKNNAFIAHDIYREQKPKLALGVAASFNAKASSPIGSDNNTIANIYNNAGVLAYADFTKIVGDFNFKHKGFSLIGEYTTTSITGKDLYSNVAGTRKLTTDTASAYYNIGNSINVQTAYIFKNGLALDFRITTIKPEFSLATSRVQEQTWYGFAVNKYLKDNAIKIGLNVNYLDDKRIVLPTKKLTGNLAIQIIM